jgi:hypothetical protein
MNSKGPRGTRRGGRKQGLGGRSSNRPPPFVPTMSLSHRFRFTNGSNAGTFVITRAQLLNLVSMATTAVTTVRVFQGVRLKQIEIWANPTALGAPPNTLSVEWLGNNGPSTIHSDNSMGVLPAHVRTKPPARSSAQWWTLSNFDETDQLFSLVLPADCVIDVTMELRLVENEAPIAGDIPAGASVGQLYGDYLDGLASGKLSPVGYIPLP